MAAAPIALALGGEGGGEAGAVSVGRVLLGGCGVSSSVAAVVEESLVVGTGETSFGTGALERVGLGDEDAAAAGDGTLVASTSGGAARIFKGLLTDKLDGDAVDIVVEFGLSAGMKTK